MSIFTYLQLQPVDPHTDGTISDLDTFEHDEIIDLTQDIDEATLDASWDAVIKDLQQDPDKLTFSEE